MVSAVEIVGDMPGFREPTGPSTVLVFVLGSELPRELWASVSAGVDTTPVAAPVDGSRSVKDWDE